MTAGPSPGRTFWMRSGARRGRQRRIEHVGLEPDDEPLAVLRHRVRRGGRDVEGQPRERAERLDAAGDARRADVPEQDEPRRLAQLDARAEHGRERARDEVDRHVPQPPLAHRRRPEAR